MRNPEFSAAPEAGEARPANEGSFADILSQFEQAHHTNGRGEAIRGVVVSITPENIFVDIGRKMDGLLPIITGQEIKVGDTVLVSVTGRDPEGNYQLSTIRVERPKDWGSLEKAFLEGTAIAGVVNEAVKGGLRVDVGVRAFMPASRSGAREAADLEKLIGQEIQCKIIKLDVTNEDVVVDRRVVLEVEEKASKERAFSEIREGAVVRGTVRSLTEFGAFVDIGGVDGLLHVADMAWSRVEKPGDIVSVGDSVEVKILKLNAQTRRISLGMKQLLPDPWSIAAERFHTGDRVQGKVSRLADFGAFIELLPGVDGLVHVSELSWSKKVRKPGDLLKAGELVDAVVLGMNAVDHRISLGLKQALGDPWEDAEKKFLPGTVVEGPVTNLTKFGAFIDLGSGLEGMIHISDMSRDKRLNHPREVLAQDQNVKAQVLEVDRDKRRIRLGMKQLEPTSADEYIGEHKAGEVVSGRLVDVANGRAKVELGEGVFGECTLPTQSASEPPAKSESKAVDLSSMTAMLAAKWKQGPTVAPTREAARAGQVRSFRILDLDPKQKRIQLELAG